MALNEWAYQAKRIPGSLHFNTPADMLAALGKDDDIVVYCSQVKCHSSVAMYQNLVDHGYRHVRRYSGASSTGKMPGCPWRGTGSTPRRQRPEGQAAISAARSGTTTSAPWRRSSAARPWRSTPTT